MTSSASTIPTSTSLIDLQQLVATVRRRRRTWLGLALAGLLLGLLATAVLPLTSTAVVRIYVVHEDEQATDSDTLIETDVALLETTQTAAAALARLGVAERPQDFREQFVAEAVAANVLEVTVDGRTDADALARAQAVADTFIADHVRRVVEAGSAEAQSLLDRRSGAEEELAALNDQIASAASQAAGQDLAAQLEALYGQRSVSVAHIQELGQKADDAGIGAARVEAGTRIVDPPRTTTRSLVAQGVFNSATGFVLGLGIGLAMAAAAAVVQDRPVLRRDIAAHVAASVIAQLPAGGRLRRWFRSSRSAAEYRRVAAVLVRVTRDGNGPVSLLELGCARTAAQLSVDVADEVARECAVVLVDDLPRRELTSLAGDVGRSISIVDGARTSMPPPNGAAGWRQIGVGSVAPGVAWTDLARLGRETVLVIKAGTASAAWLHTVARQLAEIGIAVIGVVLVDPDPRDRTDGTLWEGLHTALRGRLRARERAMTNGVGPPPSADAVSGGSLRAVQSAPEGR